MNDNPNISVTYGKLHPRIGGGRWLEAARATWGALLERTVVQQPPTTLELRPPNTPMKLAGVKADEVVVRKASLDAIQAASRESGRAEKEVEKVKAAFSSGTAEQYQELAGRYKRVVGAYQNVKAGYEAAEQRNVQLETSARIENAIREAIQPLQQENSTLHTELERWQQRAAALQVHVCSLCQNIHNMLRAVFMLKCNYSDQRPNPYRSNLTDHANHLLDALEQQGRTALTAAEQPDLANGLSGMGVTAELERKIQNHITPTKGRGHQREK